MAPRKPISYYGQFTPTGVDESSSRRFRALAGLAENIGDIATEFAQIKIEKEGKKRIREGTKAGELAGIKAAQEGTPVQTKDEKSIYLYDQAYNDALESAYFSEISTQARNEIKRLQAESPDDVEQFDKLATQYRDGVVNSVNEGYREIVDSTINNFIDANRVSVFSAQKEKRRRLANEARIANINSSSIDAATQARDGNFAEADNAVLEAETILESMLATGDITEINAYNKKRQIRREVIEQKLKYQLDQSVETDGYSGAFKTLGKMDRPEGFTPDEWSSFKASASQELTRSQSIQNASEKTKIDESKILVKNYVDAVSLGMPVSPEEKAKVAEAVNGTELQATFDRVNEVASFSLLPSGSRANILDEAAKQGIENVDDYAALLKAEQQIQTALAKDPLQFYEQQGLTELAPFDYTDEESFSQRIRQAKEASEHYGVSVPPITDAEASALSKNINAMTPDEKVELAKTLAKAPSIWGMIDQKNQHVFAMTGAIGDEDIMNAVFNGQEMIANKLVQSPSQSDYLAEFDDYVGDVYNNVDKAATRDAALAYYAAIQTPGEAFDASLFAEALDAVTGGIVEFNGFKIELPRGRSVDEFEVFIDGIDLQYISSNGGVSNAPFSYAPDIIKESRLKSVGSNEYVVLMEGNVPMLRDDGEPFIISFDESILATEDARKSLRIREARKILQPMVGL